MTIRYNFDGVELLMPTGSFQWPHPTFSGFPECCGVGTGLGNKAVPESVFGLNVSPACCIHDWMFANNPRTWEGFHHTNAVFMTNLDLINKRRGGNKLMQWLRAPVFWSWFVAVSSPASAVMYFAMGDKK